MTTINDRVTVRLFVGTPLSGEVKNLLMQSETWKKAQSHVTTQAEKLDEVRYHDKEYVGILLPTGTATLETIKSYESRVRAALRQHCPETAIEEAAMVLLPQVFVS